MNVLLLGSGGREHAIAIAVAKSPLLETLFAAPGNPGMAALASTVPLDIKDHPAVAAFCKANHIDLVVVGLEAPLVAGIVDDFSAEGIKAFGPSKAAARLEGSKAFAKEFCTRFKIPTAPYARFAGAAPAKTYVRGKGPPSKVRGLRCQRVKSTIQSGKASIPKPRLPCCAGPFACLARRMHARANERNW
jgi:phosphoribosylamine---glycine ligase